MIEVVDKGVTYRATKYTKRLNETLQVLQDRFPKFLSHIEGITAITMVDEDSRGDSSQSKAAAFYDSYRKSITLIARNIDSEEFAIYCLLHEIGHHVAEKRHGINRDYNIHSRNPAYCKEEIRAEQYAINVITTYLFSQRNWLFSLSLFVNQLERIVRERKRLVKELHQRIKHWKPYFRPSYTSVYTWGNYRVTQSTGSSTIYMKWNYTGVTSSYSSTTVMVHNNWYSFTTSVRCGLAS